MNDGTDVVSASSAEGQKGKGGKRAPWDLKGGLEKTKMGSEMMGPPRGNLSKAKSMMNLKKPVGGGRMTTTKHAVPNLARPLPSSMTTGRSTSAVFKMSVKQKEKKKKKETVSQELTSVKTENASLAKQVKFLKKELADITESNGETIRKLKREVEDLELSKSGLEKKFKKFKTRMFVLLEEED